MTPATDVAVVAPLLVGVALVAGLFGYAIGRWWIALVPVAVGLLAYFGCDCEFGEGGEDARALFATIVALPTALAATAAALGVAVRAETRRRRRRRRRRPTTRT